MNNNIAIKAENLSKKYRIGQYVGSGAQYKTLRESLTNAVSAPLRWLKSISKFEIRNSKSDTPQSDGFIWALKDVSFEVKQGEVLGIIGRNGAGKSTLLKVLSRITEPTKGGAELKGRVGSLLEVGTGFHPELTGRENVYLSGAILGMRRSEIDRKFDEIVDFSGVEKFIDTPVKRYSSGMTVRLGFAVAAHLDPDIILVDEVLAVGDYQFRKKCLGAMGEIGKEGRTVMLVSHNLTSIVTLCTRCLLLDRGNVVMDGAPKQVISRYISETQREVGEVLWDDPLKAPGNEMIRLHAVRTKSADGRITSDFDTQEEVVIQVCYWNLREGASPNVTIYLNDELNNYVFGSANLPSENTLEDKWFDASFPVGLFVTECRIPANLLNEKTYHLGVAIGSVPGHHAADIIDWDVLSFTVHDYSGRDKYGLRAGGMVNPKLAWSTQYLEPMASVNLASSEET